MDLGFVKTAALNIDQEVANCMANAEKIKNEIINASEKGVKLAVFPELCLSGGICGDIFYDGLFLSSCEDAAGYIIEETAGYDIISVIGVPVKYNSSLFNCACVIYKGDVLGIVPKSYLSKEEKRWFSVLGDHDHIVYAGCETVLGAGVIFSSYNMPDFTFGVEIGSDIFGAYPLHARMAAGGANIIAHAASKEASPALDEKYKKAILGASGHYNTAYVSSFAKGGSTQDSVFAGGGIIAENGNILSETLPFEDKCCISEADVSFLSYAKNKNDYLRDALKCEASVAFDMQVEKTTLTRKVEKAPFLNICDDLGAIITTQAAGLAKRISHTHSKKAVVGISGGLDSCLALIVAVKAAEMAGIGAKNVLAVTMPCFGTSKRTRENAEILTSCLGADFVEIAITKTVEAHLNEIGHDIEDHSVVYENAQARARTYVLMDVANKVGGLVVGTGDMSELALGWATYNGDHMSMYGVNAGVPKTLIREIIADAAKNAEEKLRNVLLDILDTPVSPELLPLKEGEMTQITEDIVGPYELHDFILYNYLVCGFSPEKIFALMKYAFEDTDAKVLKKWLMNFFKRFFSQQFKRSCLPDGAAVLGISLSPRGGLVMPSDATCDLWLNSIENL